MPNRDGTGPMGSGPKTGRGLGICSAARALKFGAGAALGLGLGYRYGFGSRFFRNRSTQQPVSKAEKEVLEEQKTIIQSRLAEINDQLEKM